MYEIYLKTGFSILSTFVIIGSSPILQKELDNFFHFHDLNIPLFDFNDPFVRKLFLFCLTFGVTQNIVIAISILVILYIKDALLYLYTKSQKNEIY